ncbi:DNA repair metallo-beta-lactamase-domain-containing protein [Trametes punicea]|nr:DNA repair metallo-beta-lactamase-domain-containing protein [Trametes punicea]
MAKKRKQTPQSSTLLDFFNKESAATYPRETKKPRVKECVTSQQRTVKKYSVPPEEIIVIDSDEDEVVVCTSPGPAPKPMNSSPYGTQESYVCKNEDAVVPAPAVVLGDLSPNVKSELEDMFTGVPSTHSPLNGSRDPSPFGFPDLLVPRTRQREVMPVESDLPGQKDCSQDRETADATAPDCPASPCNNLDVVENPLLGDADWGMGDDEMEFCDVEAQVKREYLDEVDIDLTLEDELSGTSNDRVESCPVCEKRLVGSSANQIHEHVDRCIGSVSSSSKPLCPLTTLPALHTSSNGDGTCVKAEVKEEGGDANIFSKLMTSYKENEAWKEASAVEDRNFRPTRANGGRRKAPFYKVLQGMPIAVDAFRYGTIPNVTAYFLTHAHSDHYTNLSANWKSGPIYCSEGTANLIIHMLGVDPQWVHPLPMDTPTAIPNTGGVQVTLIEANHCPGSCLFLFEGKQTVNAGDSAYKSPFVGSSKVFRYLHCGDFRASPQHVLHPAIKGKRIDHVYLDTTYLDPKYCFPPQPQVISACAELARRLVQGRSVDDAEGGKPRTMAGWFTRVDKGDKGKEKEKASDAADRVLVVVGTYSIGKERIVKAIAKALDTKVYCDSRKAAILRCQDDPELHALLTSDPLTAGVHLVPLGVIASDRLREYIERWKGRYSKVIGFRPTGWTYTPPNGSDTLPSIPTVISRSQSRTFTYANLQPMRNSTSTLQVYGVPYSEHSSFFELTCFALSLDWGRMIATVNVGSEASRGKMAKWVERWQAERKKRGGAKMVEHRAEDYW